MERVQYHLERSLPQLQLLDQAGLFTKEQLHSITSQRQSHEARLIRRAPQKVDYLRYAEFEQNLSDLIATKAARIDLDRHFTHQNYALHTGHIVSIWERLVRRFKWDVDSWQRYIDWATRRKMRVVVGRLYARALSLHPNKIPLWLSAASHELNSNSSTTAARSLLQRALRQNALPWKPRDASATDGLKRKASDGSASPGDAGKKIKTGSVSSSSTSSSATSGPLKLKLSTREAELLRLWIEYFRVELVFIERLRRRWIVLGIQWEGAEGSSALQTKSDHPEVSAAAQTLQEEAEIEDGDENERLLLAQVPEKEDGVEVETESSGRSAKPSVDSKPNSYTQRAVAEIPTAQLSILRGSIPVFLVSNALSTLPPSLHFVFLLALLELFRNFPFADSSSNAISGQQAGNKSKKAAHTFATKSGQALRSRLMDTVYDVLSDRERWTWRYFAPVASVVATRSFRDPKESLLSSEEEMEQDAQMTAELESGERLTKASLLRTTFSEDSDALLDLAEWIRMGGGNRSTTSSSAALRLILQLLEAALVERVEGEPGTTEPSLLSLRLARTGLVPHAVQQTVETIRPLCVLAPQPSNAQSSISSSNPKSDFYTAATLLLNLLSDSARSGIDEPNLLRYLDAVKTELITEARAAGDGVESGQMRASILRKKYSALAAVVDEGDSGSLNGDLKVNDKRRKKLAKAIKEVEEATAPTAKGGFPGCEDLWRLRIELKAALLKLEDADAEIQRQHLSAEWTRGLLAASNAELDSADSDEATGDDTSALQGSLWGAYFDWVQHEFQRAVALIDGGKSASKVVKKAASWVHSEYEASIRVTSSLLSRSAASKIGATSKLSSLQDRKQATHDLVLKRYASICSEIDSRLASSNSGRKRKATNLGKAIETCLSSSFGSEDFYRFLIDLLVSVRSSTSPPHDAEGGEEETASLSKLDAKIMQIYQRSIDILSSQLSASGRSAASMAAESGKLADTWISLLSYLVEVKKEDMGSVLRTLESGKRSCKAAFGKDEDRAMQEVRMLEKGWERMCSSGPNGGGGIADGEEEGKEEVGADGSA